MKILGTRGEIEEEFEGHKKHSGILIDSILFDLGEEDFLKYNPKAIVITHLHPDHFFPSRKEEYPEELKKIPVYAPERPEWIPKDANFIALKEPISMFGLKITPLPTIHSKKVLSQGYKVEVEGKSIIYTGDIINFKDGAKEDRDKIFKNVDLYIGDGSFFKEGGMIRRDDKTGDIYGHTGIPDQIKWCLEQGVKHIIFTHFGNWIGDEKQVNKLLEETKDVGLKLAKDGVEIDLSKLALMPEDVEAITPETFPKEPEVGLYLVEPHGRLIAEGKKTLTVKTVEYKEHINEPVYLFSDKLCFGVIVLGEPEKISEEEFWNRKDEHCITREEFEKWGFKGKELYAYPVSIVEIYDPPKPVRLPRGIQNWVKDFKILEPKEMTNEELEMYHSLYHKSAELFNPYCKAHFQIAMEMLNRNLIHIYRSSCDRVVELEELIREATKDWVNQYIRNIKKYTKAQVGDDWRIVLSWYSSLREGKKLMKHIKGEDIHITEGDCKKLAVAIVKELIERGATFNKPETYKEHARELFEYVIREIGEDKIPWKEEMAFRFPEGKGIEDIDIDFVMTLTDEELIQLYKYLHEVYRKEGANEPLYNANIIVGIELLKRGLYDDNKIEDGLTEKTDLEIVEYPTPKGFSEELRSYTIEELYEALPSAIAVEGQPYAAYAVGRAVNEGTLPPNHDFDILFRQFPDPRVIKVMKNIEPSWLAELIHVSFDPNGPSVGFSYPLLKYGFFKVSKEEFIKGFGPYRQIAQKEELVKLEPFMKFRALKAKAGWEKNEFFEFDSLWKNWASKYIDRKIVVQKKADGRRFLIHKKGDEIQIITEDQMRDRSDAMPNVEKDLREKFKADSLIMDAEGVCYDLKGKHIRKAVDKDKLGEELPREDFAYLTVGKITPEQEEGIVFIVHDLLYLNGKPLNNEPYIKRFEMLKDVIPKDSEFFIIMPSTTASNLAELREAVQKMRTWKGSEGCMLKVSDSIYPIKTGKENRSPEWAKLKNLKSAEFIVYAKVPKRESKTGKIIPGVWEYDCAFAIPKEEIENWRPEDLVEIKGKIYAKIGRTFSTSVEVPIGGIVEVLTGRIREYTDKKTGKHYMTWMFPKFKEWRKDKTEPDTLDTIRKLAKVGPGFIASMSLIVRLSLCPFYQQRNICPLKRIFGKPRYQQLSVYEERLRFPIACPLASRFRCRYVKAYYYGLYPVGGEGERTNEQD